MKSALKSALNTPATTLRLDVWLWQARFCRTRALAARFCDSGAVRVDGRPGAKRATPIRAGQVLTFALARQVRVVRIEALGVRRGPAAEAVTLYCDLAPPGETNRLPVR